MVEIATCPNGHRFPINRRNHINRRERICPTCRAEVIIRKRFSFKPTVGWSERKKEQRELRRVGAKKPTLVPFEARLGRLPLALVTSLLRRKEELEKEKR